VIFAALWQKPNGMKDTKFFEHPGSAVFDDSHFRFAISSAHFTKIGIARHTLRRSSNPSGAPE
jgi:hypothetical protein